MDEFLETQHKRTPQAKRLVYVKKKKSITADIRSEIV
jgi:hypothetical protein